MKFPLLFSGLAMILVAVPVSAQQNHSPSNDTLYHSDQLVITRLSKHSYVHTSYFYSNSFGKVPCNGMIVIDNNEAIVFDTPASDSSSVELINWIQKQSKSNIKAIIPTHFHEDCLGGLKEFNKYHIPSYASHATIMLAKAQAFPVPSNGFEDQLVLTVGTQKIYARFLVRDIQEIILSVTFQPTMYFLEVVSSKNSMLIKETLPTPMKKTGRQQ